jgi:hypothetical protein
MEQGIGFVAAVSQLTQAQLTVRKILAVQGASDLVLTYFLNLHGKTPLSVCKYISA